MADNRTFTTFVHANIVLLGRDIDLFEFNVVADWCEEHGYEYAAALLRDARERSQWKEPERQYGWSRSIHSAMHFFPPGSKYMPLCRTDIARAKRGRSFYHYGHVCQRCAAELERRQAEFPEAWEAHLISMDEARPLLTGKEPPNAGTEG